MTEYRFERVLPAVGSCEVRNHACGMAPFPMAEYSAPGPAGGPIRVIRVDSTVPAMSPVSLLSPTYALVWWVGSSVQTTDSTG